MWEEFDRKLERIACGGRWLEEKSDCVLNCTMIECHVILCLALCKPWYFYSMIVDNHITKNRLIGVWHLTYYTPHHKNIKIKNYVV